MRRCARCGEDKPVSEFGWKNKERTRLHSYCKPCVRANSKAHYAANKTRYLAKARRRDRRERTYRTYLLVEYFKSHPCVDCGETDPLVLEFDHRGGKEFSIGHDIAWRPWAEVVNEIEKCDVRCANCHRRKTAERGGFLRLVLGDDR
jgi:hypothetical protein